MRSTMKKSSLVVAMLCSGVLAASCGNTEGDGEEIAVVQGAVTQITISGKVSFSNGTAVPGVPVRLNGLSQATSITNTSGNYSFSVVAGSYSVRPEKTGC